MKLTLTSEKLNLIRTNNLTLDEFYILYCKALKKDSRCYRPSTEVYNNLVNKKLLTKNKTISKSGREIVESIQNIFIKQKRVEDSFNQFWELYPRNDAHSIYPRTSALRENKPKCRLVYKDLIKEGFDAEEINQALNNHVDYLKNASIRENQLKYLGKSINWLSKRKFEGWIDEKDSEPIEFITVN